MVTRREKDGTITTLAETYGGRKFNSPNDLDLDAEGNIYFTDPSWSPVAKRNMPELGVYFLPKDGGEVKQLTTDLKKPNGIALSPDGKTLYIADNDQGLVVAYDVTAPGEISNRRVFVQPGGKGGPDGMTTDSRGNLYAAWHGGNAVYVWNPAGEMIATIAFGPDQPTNVELADGENSLYITGGKVLHKADVSSLR